MYFEEASEEEDWSSEDSDAMAEGDTYMLWGLYKKMLLHRQSEAQRIIAPIFCFLLTWLRAVLPSF